MYNFLNKLGNKRCCGMTSNYDQCEEIIISFSSGIYFCYKHGNIINSPYHSILYGYRNDHSHNKIFLNKYFSSKFYNRKLIKNRYIKVYNRIIKENIIKLNTDVLYLILQYL